MGIVDKSISVIVTGVDEISGKEYAEGWRRGRLRGLQALGRIWEGCR